MLYKITKVSIMSSSTVNNRSTACKSLDGDRQQQNELRARRLALVDDYNMSFIPDSIENCTDPVSKLLVRAALLIPESYTAVKIFAHHCPSNEARPSPTPSPRQN
jgi:hypothetical protein